MSTRRSRGRTISNRPTTSSRPRQTYEVVLAALQHGKPRRAADSQRGGSSQNPHEFRDFLRKALANVPTDRRTLRETPFALEAIYGEDISHIRWW